MIQTAAWSGVLVCKGCVVAVPINTMWHVADLQSLCTSVDGQSVEVRPEWQVQAKGLDDAWVIWMFRTPEGWHIMSHAKLSRYEWRAYTRAQREAWATRTMHTCRLMAEGVYRGAK